MNEVFVAGGTGFLGLTLVERLCLRGFAVKAVARPASIHRLPAKCDPIPGDVLDANTYRDRIPPNCTFVHLVGVRHPAPWKADAFLSVDFASLVQSVEAAHQAQAAHFVYVSVAQPAPLMKAYVRTRARCENVLRGSRLAATILRPWYVLGPGHRWPLLLKPLYAVCEAIPATREAAVRLGLVTREQMIAALECVVLEGPRGIRILETAWIRDAYFNAEKSVGSR